MRQEKKNEKKRNRILLKKSQFPNTRAKRRTAKKNKRQIEALSAKTMAFRMEECEQFSPVTSQICLKN